MIKKIKNLKDSIVLKYLMYKKEAFIIFDKKNESIIHFDKTLLYKCEKVDNINMDWIKTCNYFIELYVDWYGKGFRRYYKNY